MTPRRSLEQAKKAIDDLNAVVKSEIAAVERDLAITLIEIGRKNPS